MNVDLIHQHQHQHQQRFGGVYKSGLEHLIWMKDHLLSAIPPKKTR
ncbi:hypothetical protein BgramDRAFT_4987 [Paraburkholderia graminis C4D1M]|uniref:Uncharacterized protein n=1 Tax=Paraburkholderia graminis (strain ATCC 700544 / DSM 17151 / LMG 18924 / NCIMB 13744 / C4D1M) TaxID=396598 RepID=B1G6M6_PARG4|nr:hypothetical protein BgramDRAFT_4987 [Paraburkholderia graminis C4D1M]